MIYFFCISVGLIIGLLINRIFGKDVDIKDDSSSNTKGDSETDREPLRGDNSDLNVSNDANSYWICDVRYLEELQDQVTCLKGFASIHEREILDKVIDLIEFMMDVLSEDVEEDNTE